MSRSILVAFSLLIGNVLFLGVPEFVHGDSGFYVRGELGGSFSQELGGAFVGNLGESVGFGLGIGYRFLPTLRIDFVGTYRPYFAATVSDALLRFQGKVTNFTVMSNVYWDIIQLGRFTPYMGAGIGLSRNETRDAEVAADSPFAVLEPRLSGTVRNNFAYQAMAGLSLHVISKFELDMSYHYLHAGEVAYSSGKLLGEEFHFFPTNPQEMLRLHEVFFSIRYNF